MTKQEQGRLDLGNGDLPLFSGTPVTVDGGGARRTSSGAQLCMAACRVCLDTGRVRVRPGRVVFCTCSAGLEARRKEQEHG